MICVFNKPGKWTRHLHWYCMCFDLIPNRALNIVVINEHTTNHFFMVLMLTKQKPSFWHMASTLLYPNSWFVKEITTRTDFLSVSVPLCWAMLVISHPLDSGSSCSVLCLPFYVPLVFFIFTVPANAYCLLTCALEVQFDWHSAAWRIARHKSDDRLALQRQTVSRSLPLHVVHSEMQDSRAGANTAKIRRKAGQCYQLQHAALSIVVLSIRRQSHWLFHFTRELIVWNESSWYKSRGPAVERRHVLWKRMAFTEEGEHALGEAILDFHCNFKIQIQSCFITSLQAVDFFSLQSILCGYITLFTQHWSH